MYQKFNTHSVALDNRIKAHDKFGSQDLNAWIFDKVKLSHGDSVLDIGCGRGKQSIEVDKRVGAKGQVTSVDLSKESLDCLLDAAHKKNLLNIKTHQCDIDNLFTTLDLGNFDAVVSSYALYYTKNTELTIKNIYNQLNPDGQLFFCGPSKNNNSEIKAFHYDIKGSEIPQNTFASIFMEEAGLKVVNETFGESSIFQFENSLKFDTAESLYLYWSSYNLYDSAIADAFKVAAERHFKVKDEFVTTKRVIGILGKKK